MMLGGGASEATFQPTPELLREIVLDVLLHNSYINTAKAFAKECAATARLESGGVGEPDVQSDGVHEADLAAVDDDCMITERVNGEIEEGNAEFIPEEEQEFVRLRRDIRLNILAGHVDEATHLLNTHFPAVLNQDEVDAPSTSTSASAAAQRSNSAAPTLQARVNYTSQASTNPIHVALNLRVQAFIEATRTIPLPNPPGYSRTAPSALASSSADSQIAHQTDLLHRAQRLYAEVEALRDPEDKKIYRQELSHVGGLLAYRVPETSPLSHFMDQNRRDAVADQVNSAILSHFSKATLSSLELIVRQTSTVWSVLHDNNYTLPLPGLWPAGVTPPRHSSEHRHSPAPRTSGKAEKDAEIVPYFEFKEFLGA